MEESSTLKTGPLLVTFFQYDSICVPARFSLTITISIRNHFP